MKNNFNRRENKDANLNEVETASGGSNAPHGGGFDVRGLYTEPRW